MNIKTKFYLPAAFWVVVTMLALSAIRISAQGTYTTPYTFGTLAGGVTIGINDGTGSAAEFNAPYGVAVDNTGMIYVADWYNYTIRKITPTGDVTTLAGQARIRGFDDGTNSGAQFAQPTGVSLDGANNLYVADGWSLRRVTPDGVVTTIAGMANTSGSNDGTGSDARFNGLVRVAVDKVNNIIYVADEDNHTIRKVTPAGVVTTFAGSAGSPGNIDATGSDARFKYPMGLTVDGAGNIYVADSGNNEIRKITPSGEVTTLAGTTVTGSIDGAGVGARFNVPVDVAVDNAGNVFVADFGNSEIRMITPSGQTSTLAGKAPLTGNTDGTGSDVRFDSPAGVALDIYGGIYVADTGYSSIRKGFYTNALPTIVTVDESFGFKDGQFGFNVVGIPGRMFEVEASDDLSNWQPVSNGTFPTNTIGSGAFFFSDPNSSDVINQPSSFYRVHLE